MALRAICGEAIRTVFGDGTEWLLRTFQPIHLANKQEDREGHQDEAKDVDREFVTLFTIFDENTSWYLEHNIQAYVSDPKSLNKLEFAPVDDQGVFSLVGTGFVGGNFKATINGYIFGNMPMMTMKKGERVRWYVVSIGEAS